MNSVKLYISSNIPHIRQVVTGFKMLERQGLIALDIVLDYSNIHKLPHDGLIEAVVNEKLKIAFDVLDGYNFDSKEVNSYLNNSGVSYYFKRSYNKKINDQLFKGNSKLILPLSFNYCVTYFANPIDWKNKNLLRTFFKKLLLPETVSFYENDNFSGDGTIIFMTRLWGDNNMSDIDSMRIDVIRRLKETYGKNFVGGLYDNALARKIAPDLIIDKSKTFKSNYIRLMKKSTVCIASKGLHNSIGWKFAEYVIAGKAIASEKLDYDVYGEFKKDENYLEWSNADECLEVVNKMYDDAELRSMLEYNNKKYYEEHLRPDKMIEDCLNRCGIRL